jgi:membrane peptidoglycan carboxypeptidase
LSSKADDFDVRFRDDREGRAWGSGADGNYANGDHDDGGYAGNDHGAVGGTVDYDLGYDANGWDTQGFRSPTAGYLDNHETAQPGNDVRTAPRRENGRGGSHARTSSTQQVGPLNWAPDAPDAPHAPDAPDAPGSTGPWLPVPPGSPLAPGRRGRRARTGGPGGPKPPRGGLKVKGSWWRHWTWRKALGLLLSIIGGIIVLLVVAVAYIYSHTPVPAEQMALSLSSQSVVYASDGHTVIGRFGSTDRQVVTYQQIPAQIIDSVLSAEDRNFFNEGGVSPTSILRAAWQDTLGGGNFQGGSTITQQFVRNYYQGIGTSQTASRKIKEIFVAMKVSRQKSKQWILENYLNTIYLGQGAYGIGAAAQTYFNIPVSKLSTISWSQAALLAAIIQQPSTYPLLQYRNDLVARWQYVRDGLRTMGWITPQTYAQMKFPAFGDNTPGSYGKDVWDPYVTDVVKSELKNVYGYTESQLLNGGYKIVTTIDPVKMRALYQAVITEKQSMAGGGEPLQSYMHIGAALENPQTGAIEAFYGGPGYPGWKYDGYGRHITVKECKVINCEENMAIYAREQVGSSFKPYVLSAAVAAGMNVQGSLLDGQDFVCIPPDSSLYPGNLTIKNAYPDPAGYPKNCQPGWDPMSNDSTGENGAFSAQDAMTNSVNTAYADLWHYVGGQAVVHMAAMFGVRTDSIATGGSGLAGMEHEAGVALGQASLSVLEQTTMLAAIDNGGTYHAAHVIGSISQGGARYPLSVRSYPVFSQSPTVNSEMASQVQYVMSKVAYDGTGAAAGMSDGRPIIAKTGTTNTAQSAFFIGAIPQESLAIGIFTNHQSGKLSDPQTLNGLGGISQGFGGTWPAMIWHSYAQNMFIPLGTENFQPAVFTGAKWILVPANLRNVGQKHPKKKHDQNPNPGNGGFPSPPPGNGNPNPYPTYSCDPSVVTCNPNAPGGGGNTQSVSAVEAGAAMGGIFAGLPATCLWVRRRARRGVTKRG